MKSIGAFEAKTHLSELLVRAVAGESIEITRHGKPVALLVPIGTEVAKVNSEETIQAFGQLQKEFSLGGLSAKDLVNEGRKY